MQKSALLEMVDSEAVMARLREKLNPDLLDLRRERDLGDLLGVLLTVAVPLIYAGLQSGGGSGTPGTFGKYSGHFAKGNGREIKTRGE